MRVTVTGGTGLIGSRLVSRLRERGDEVTVFGRTPPAPEDLDGRDAVVHLAGESISQRWTAEVKRRIRDSRERGTRELVATMRRTAQPPPVLVSASAVGYYGPRGDERLAEDAAPGDDFLAEVCKAWEREALAAREDGTRVVVVRTSVVLDAAGGALARMLPFFKLGVGGPVAGGRQYMAWIHLDDLVAVYMRALDEPSLSGPVNAAAPEPVTNREFGRTLGRALRRPAFAPVPGFAVRLLFGEMAHIVVTGQRAVPQRLLELGFDFSHPELEPALRSALRR